MKKILLLLLIIHIGALYGAPSTRGKENLAVQELRHFLDQVNYDLHGHQVEIDLFQQRIEQLEKTVEKMGGELKKGKQDRTLESRLVKLEKAHETLIADFKNLKGHLNETTAALASCQAKLSKIDNQLSSDIKGLKNSLESMLALLQKEGEAQEPTYYTVKPGDSLGQIALDHKTDVKSLKQANHLSSDTIYTGQKLALP